MTLKLIAIGGLGKMLGPTAKHLLESSEAQFVRVQDRGKTDVYRDACREDWKAQGASLVPTLEDLVGDGDFDGIVICAGKNGEDYDIFRQLIPLLKKHSTKKYFILHMSTVSCDFVTATHAFCQKHNIDYVNYPVTGGALGAQTAKMLILASGNKALYARLEPMLKKIGVPKYFGEEVTLGTCVKLIGHVLVFSGLLGYSSAVLLQKNIFGFEKLDPAQVDFFDFLNNGSGGSRQWDVALRQAVLQNNWEHGFLLLHAAVDIIYTIDLMLSKQLASTLTLPLCELSLLFSYLMHNADYSTLGTHAVLHLLACEPKEKIDHFIYTHLDHEHSMEKCIAALPEHVRTILMLKVNYE